MIGRLRATISGNGSCLAEGCRANHGPSSTKTPSRELPPNCEASLVKMPSASKYNEDALTSPKTSRFPPCVRNGGPSITAAPIRYVARNAAEVVRHQAEHKTEIAPTCTAVTDNAHAKHKTSDSSTPPRLYATANSGMESNRNEAIGTRRPSNFSNTIVHGPSFVSSNSANVSRSFSLVSTPQVIAGRNRYSPANCNHAIDSNNSRPRPKIENELLFQLPS